jgi:hypothetical protein
MQNGLSPWSGVTRCRAARARNQCPQFTALTRYCEIVETRERDAFGHREAPALAFEQRTDGNGIR